MDDVVDGLKACFDDLGWQWPTGSIPPKMKLALNRACKDEDIAPGERANVLREIWADYEGYVGDAAEVAQRRAERAANPQPLNENNLFKAVNELQGKLTLGESFPGFTTDDGRRGDCPWHNSTSGNSAWADQGNDGKWYYHCPTCTDNQGLNAYQFHVYGETEDFEYPRGRDAIELSKSFLESHGQDTSQFDRDFNKSAGPTFEELFGEPEAIDDDGVSPEYKIARNLINRAYSKRIQSKMGPLVDNAPELFARALDAVIADTEGKRLPDPGNHFGFDTDTIELIGDHNKAYIDSYKKGTKLVINKSGTGEGKTYQAVSLTLRKLLGIEKIIYVVPDPFDLAKYDSALETYSLIEFANNGTVLVEEHGVFRERRAPLDTPAEDLHRKPSCQAQRLTLDQFERALR